MKFVSKGPPINNIPALVQKMAWRRPGAKPFLNKWWLVYWHIYMYVSFGLNELKRQCDIKYSYAFLICFNWRLNTCDINEFTTIIGATRSAPDNLS